MRPGVYLANRIVLLSFVCLILAGTARAATFTVNSTQDGSDANPGDGFCTGLPGICTLRAAIEEANASGGADTIAFAIAGAGVKTFTPSSAYPVITGRITIDGWTQGGAGYSGPPLIQIDGTGAGAGVDGLQISAGTSVIRGLIINRFDGNGIKLLTNGDNNIQGCYIGISSSGAIDRGNGLAGILISFSNNNTVGAGTAHRNVISANDSYGIQIESATGNVISSNYIGTDAGGTLDLGNNTAGIFLDYSASDNTIGGTTVTARNVISGTGGPGVEIDGRENVVIGNYIGTDAGGTADVGNDQGIYVTGGLGAYNRIGGTTAGERNVISGNFSAGIEITRGFSNSLPSNNQIIGNYIGTDASGTLPLGNHTDGVKIFDGQDNTVGGTTAGQRNIISANERDGVQIYGSNAYRNVVTGNYIGTDVSGTLNLGNLEGISIHANAINNTIGGTAAGEGNVVAFSLNDGIEISGTEGTNTTGNSIRGNSIFSNQGLGIDLLNDPSDDGVTPNDTGDPDTDANNLQNYPVLTQAVNQGGNTDIAGSLNSTANTEFSIDFFSNPSCDSSGNGEGETYVGSITVTTDAGGDTSFNFSPVVQVALGRFITATATRNASPYDTSEFSECFQVVNPDPPVVVNTNDSGAGSLRQAILNTNSFAGIETIRFDIPGGGVKTINLLSPLPTITDPVIIDGTSQPGFAGFPLIELNGTSAGAGADGLNIIAGGSTVRSLIINRFDGDGIELATGGGNTIKGCAIGTNAGGTVDFGNTGNGIYINESANNHIGGASPSAHNLISGNDLNGILISGSSTGNELVGNSIGTDFTRTVDLGNSENGIDIVSASNNIIGGTAANVGNLISGNDMNGIRITTASGNLIRNNLIGTDGSGTADLGNTLNGVSLSTSATNNTIGGATGGNTIAFNARGVRIDTTATGNSIRGNAIAANDNLGIDLAPNGSTPNDLGDADTGANNLQNFPVLTNVFNQTGSTTVQGSLNSTANTSFTIDFFSNTSCDPSGNGEGQTYIGSTTATTDASGNIPFSFSTAAQLPLGRFITTTATRNVAPLDTSEFSQCVAVVEGPGNLTFSATGYATGENAGSKTITVNRTDNSNGQITVSYATSNGTATAGQDYTATSGTLTFLDGETVKTFDIPITDDSLDEAGETVNLTLSNPSANVSLTPNATAVLTIVDNDAPPQLSIDNVSLTEGDVGTKQFTFTVQLSTASSFSITVDYATANGTATFNQDYLPTSGQLSFAPGETAKTISVTVLGDLTVELNETLFVNLSNPVNASFGDNQGLGIIVDDDNPGKFSFSLAPYTGVENTSVLVTVARTGGTAGTVSVDYETGGGSATPFADYTPASGTLVFGDGETIKTFTVNLLDDAAPEPTENFNVFLSNPIGGAILGSPSVAAINILDNDSGTLLTISGEVTLANNVPVPNVTMTLQGASSATTITNNLGHYSFANLAPNGNYSVTPSALGGTFTPLNRQYNNLSADVTNANFTVTPAPSRQLRIIGGNATPTQDITVNLELVAQGDENAAGVSLNYDAAILTNPTALLGPDALNGFLTLNTSQAGKLGVLLALPSGTSFAAGTKQIVTVTFNTLPTAVYNSPVTFGDIPIVKQVVNTNADPLPTNYLDGAVTFAQGYEADVAPRPTGNNNGSITAADFIQVGRFVAGLDTLNANFNEFQRADTAPRVTLGNGSLSVADFIQAGRYAAGIDAPTLTGGQYAPSAAEQIATAKDLARNLSLAPTTVRVVNAQAIPNTQVIVSVETDAQGTENGFGFTLHYDQTKLSNPIVTLGSGVPANSTLIPFTPPTGRVGVVLGLPFNTGLTAGTKQLVTISFDVAANAPGGQTALTFSDLPVVREVSDLNANVMTSTFQGGQITILSPTAADATISGRILANDGSPVAGAIVNLSGTQTRVTITDASGNYRFVNVEANGFYTVTPLLVNYSFSPSSRSFSLVGNRTDAVFTAIADSVPSANPLDTAEYFVRQQYLDFLGREPDQGGFDYWSAQLHACGADASCLRQRRLDVSAAFFVEQEFQLTGSFVYRLYQGSLGRQPNYAEFTNDRSRVVAGVNLEENKIALVDEWINRAEFAAQYPSSLTNAAFVIKLFDRAGLEDRLEEQQQQIAAMDAGRTRAQVLRELIEIQAFKDREYNRAFVLMQYFGYLRRDVDRNGYDFWLNVLNNSERDGYRGMVCAFITSAEYQRRFSALVTHSNLDCAR